MPSRPSCSTDCATFGGATARSALTKRLYKKSVDTVGRATRELEDLEADVVALTSRRGVSSRSATRRRGRPAAEGARAEA